MAADKDKKPEPKKEQGLNPGQKKLLEELGGKKDKALQTHETIKK